MLEVILTICGILGGLAAIDYFWGKWYTAKIVQGVLKKLRPKSSFIEHPDCTVPLDSLFYVERPPIEAECYETVIQPGALIQIKTPHKRGKTSLIMRIINHANQQGYRTAYIPFQEADEKVFADLKQFLRWFCISVTSELKLPNKLDDYWPETSENSKGNCKNYFQQYLLPKSNSPIVLGLDTVDHIFQYIPIAKEFFGLLRAWHERGQHDQTWEKLRLIIVHSDEVIPLNENESPFNVVEPVQLPDFDHAQVQNLVRRHNLNCSKEQVEQLMTMLGGHPYLVRVALYQMAQKGVTLPKLLQVAPMETGPYAYHLRRLLFKLTKSAELAKTFKRVITATQPVPLDELEEALKLKLRSMGLVKFQKDDTVVPLCELYCLYFRHHLKD